ncbi:MAG: riboflavin kinase [Candidatus Andersenbacteria bacterium]|nr:riboflavin kinase [Candidatus Andersenbacteria bacterium]
MANDTQQWLTGAVVRGSGRGKGLGFPTANIRLSAGSVRPADGVYACWVKVGSEAQLYRGALHSGPRPTYGDAQPTVEVHLINFPARDLYGQDLSFCCVARLRDVHNFASADQLRNAIERDCQMAINALV